MFPTESDIRMKQYEISFSVPARSIKEVNDWANRVWGPAGLICRRLYDNDKDLISSLANFYKDKEIRHIDGDIHNYDINNLEIVTKKAPEEILAEENKVFIKSLPGIEEDVKGDLPI